MKKTNVFVEASAYYSERPSGIGHLVQNTIRELALLSEFNESYELVLFGYEKDTFSHGDLAYRKLPKLPTRAAHLLNDKKLLRPVDRLLGQGIYLFPNFMKFPVSAKSRSVLWVHDLVYERFPETVAPRLQKRLHKSMPYWLKNSSGVIAISEFGAQEIKQFYGPHFNVDIVYAGADPTVFYKRTAQETSRVQQKYGLPQKYILFVGNLEPRKNLARLLQALYDASHPLPKDYSFVIIGGNSWKNTAFEKEFIKAKQKGVRIVLPSTYVSDQDMPAVMSGATLLVHPALYEGFGITPLEARLCGVPVIVSDIPPLKELLQQEVIYFDPQRSSDIARAIHEGLHGATGHNTASERLKNYTWHTAAVQLLGTIKGLSDTIRP